MDTSLFDILARIAVPNKHDINLTYQRSPTVAASYSWAIEAPNLPPKERIFVNLRGRRNPDIASLRSIVYMYVRASQYRCMLSDGNSIPEHLAFCKHYTI
jgi:hypothetical protein